jgi:hypothetical protein
MLVGPAVVVGTVVLLVKVRAVETTVELTAPFGVSSLRPQ